ncbi:ABC transporter substrate-binding protein [Halococcus hamelinensis]|nr:ABC transporter substrate-binding protein [Halococcus hamelinensis]
MPASSNTRRQFLKSGVVATAGLSALSGCTGVGGVGGGGTPSLNLAYTVPVENVSSLMAIPEIRDQMENLGSDYELSVSRNSATPDTLNQMSAGEVDIGLLSSVSYANAVAQDAVPGGIKLVATDFWDAHPDNYGFTTYSLPDSNITSPQDMRGATVATNGLGTGTHAVYVKMFQKVGLTPGQNVEVVELGFPNMTAALEEGRIDVGLYAALFAPQARNKNFNVVFDSHDVWKQYPFAYLAARNRTIENNQDALNAWGQDYVRLLDYIQKNRSKVVSWASEQFDIEQSTIDAFFLTKNDYYREDPVTDIQRMQTVIDNLVSLGMIDSGFNVGEHITNQFVKS